MLPSYGAAEQQLLLPTTMDRLNLSIGLNLVFFERKPKSERKANKPVKTAEKTPEKTKK
jgi:hypothetical protein